MYHCFNRQFRYAVKLAVYCGKQSYSYHGTTVQLVQPDATITYPSMNILSSPQIIDDTAMNDILLNDNTTKLQSSSQRHRSHL